MVHFTSKTTRHEQTTTAVARIHVSRPSNTTVVLTLETKDKTIESGRWDQTKNNFTATPRTNNVERQLLVHRAVGAHFATKVESARIGCHVLEPRRRRQSVCVREITSFVRGLVRENEHVVRPHPLEHDCSAGFDLLLLLTRRHHQFPVDVLHRGCVLTAPICVLHVLALRAATVSVRLAVFAAHRLVNHRTNAAAT